MVAAAALTLGTAACFGAAGQVGTPEVEPAGNPPVDEVPEAGEGDEGAGERFDCRPGAVVRPC